MSISTSSSVHPRATLSKNPLTDVFATAVVESPHNHRIDGINNINMIFERYEAEAQEAAEADVLQKRKDEEQAGRLEEERRLEEEEAHMIEAQNRALKKREEEEIVRRQEVDVKEMAVLRKQEELQEAEEADIKAEVRAAYEREREQEVARKKENEDHEARHENEKTRREEVKIKMEEESKLRIKEARRLEEALKNKGRLRREEEAFIREQEDESRRNQIAIEKQRLERASTARKDADQEEKLRRAMEAAEAREALVTKQIHKLPSRKTMVLKSFEFVRTALSTIISHDEDLTSSLNNLRRRPVIVNQRALMQQLPNIPRKEP